MEIKIDNYWYCEDCLSNHNCFNCDRMLGFWNKTKQEDIKSVVKDEVKSMFNQDKIKYCEECYSQFFWDWNLCYNCLRK